MEIVSNPAGTVNNEKALLPLCKSPVELTTRVFSNDLRFIFGLFLNLTRKSCGKKKKSLRNVERSTAIARSQSVHTVFYYAILKTLVS
jgi:hypothetical protein